MLVLSNFFFCRNVFKKLSAAEASESVYMREKVNRYKILLTLINVAFVYYSSSCSLFICDINPSLYPFPKYNTSEADFENIVTKT